MWGGAAGRQGPSCIPSESGTELNGRCEGYSRPNEEVDNDCENDVRAERRPDLLVPEHEAPACLGLVRGLLRILRLLDLVHIAGRGGKLSAANNVATWLVPCTVPRKAAPVDPALWSLGASRASLAAAAAGAAGASCWWYQLLVEMESEAAPRGGGGLRTAGDGPLQP